MAEAIGRPLLHTEHVHHIDGNRLNNALSNLQLLHISQHNRCTHARKPPVLYCWQCGSPIPSRNRTRWYAGSSPDLVRVFCCHPCYGAWLRRVYAARRNDLPLPTKAPVCPLEDLLFPT